MPNCDDLRKDAEIEFDCCDTCHGERHTGISEPDEVEYKGKIYFVCCKGVIGFNEKMNKE